MGIQNVSEIQDLDPSTEKLEAFLLVLLRMLQRQTDGTQSTSYPQEKNDVFTIPFKLMTK